MPTKYSERLLLPSTSERKIVFTTLNGLEIATNYEKIVFSIPSPGSIYKKPFIEFDPKHIVFENIKLPNSQKWRESNIRSPYVEFRSKDFTNIKIMRWKINSDEFSANMFYISPFDLKTSEFPVLIQPLKRKN